jgi:hypothetical protein
MKTLVPCNIERFTEDVGNYRKNKKTAKSQKSNKLKKIEDIRPSSSTFSPSRLKILHSLSNVLVVTGCKIPVIPAKNRFFFIFPPLFVF